MSVELRPLIIAGEHIGDLVPMGDRFSFFTARADLKPLVWQTFASIEEATVAVRRSLARVPRAEDAVRRDTARGVKLAVSHHPSHDVNVDRMIRSMRASLTYYGEQFGPYQYKELRIVEFPRYASFARAHPHTITFSEGSAFLTRVDSGDVDRTFFVVAHEAGGEARLREGGVHVLGHLVAGREQHGAQARADAAQRGELGVVAVEPAGVGELGEEPSLVVEGFRREGEDVMDAYQYFIDDGTIVGRSQVGTFRFDAHGDVDPSPVSEVASPSANRTRRVRKEGTMMRGR